ncbi:hypothetical protein B0T22DRAFT_441912 [Podospora appendiculata]|uniref:Uncharacterized protein n=1 Tax=Podospora appendiculata TaxID=314037 RepID=A0AAE1CE80_9PEZI|nr:hypothetical protein B0T22DRAFT_441912 [Podospora appendiculata]
MATIPDDLDDLTQYWVRRTKTFFATLHPCDLGLSETNLITEDDIKNRLKGRFNHVGDSGEVLDGLLTECAQRLAERWSQPDPRTPCPANLFEEAQVVRQILDNAIYEVYHLHKRRDKIEEINKDRVDKWATYQKALSSRVPSDNPPAPIPGPDRYQKWADNARDLDLFFNNPREVFFQALDPDFEGHRSVQNKISKHKGFAAEFRLRHWQMLDDYAKLFTPPTS